MNANSPSLGQKNNIPQQSTENKRTIVKIVSLAVSIAGITVMLGWLFDIRILKSIHQNYISMKFDTAICFLLSGIALYFIIRVQEGEIDYAQVVIPIISLIILLFMGTLFLSTLFGIHTGIEDIFIKETSLSAKTVAPGQPSLPTTINFILIALAGILTTLQAKNIRLKLKIIGLIIGIIGALAVTGYIINTPMLYYYIEGVNSAMAIHTAILFVALGAGLLCL